MSTSYCYSLLITLIGHAAMPAAAEALSPAATDTTAGMAATLEEQNAELAMLRGELQRLVLCHITNNYFFQLRSPR